MAAPKKYNPKYHDAWAWSLAMKGCDNKEIAEAMGISARTVIRWSKTTDSKGNEILSSFGEALQEGKDAADAKVEKKLYERALGYDVEESENTVDIDPNGNIKPVRRKTTKKHIAPDTMAIMYWLNNRRRGEWAQRQDINVGGTVRTVDVSNLSDEELRSLARIGGEDYGE